MLRVSLTLAVINFLLILGVLCYVGPETTYSFLIGFNIYEPHPENILGGLTALVVFAARFVFFPGLAMVAGFGLTNSIWYLAKQNVPQPAAGNLFAAALTMFHLACLTPIAIAFFRLIYALYS